MCCEILMMIMMMMMMILILLVFVFLFSPFCTPKFGFDENTISAAMELPP